MRASWITMLSYDFVLRRNHCINLESDSPTPFKFALTRHDSLRILLIDHASRGARNALFLRSSEPKYAQLFNGLQEAPVFHVVSDQVRRLG